MNSAETCVSRRQLLALGWFPFLRPRHIDLAGARFRILRNGHSSRCYLRIHGNEETARQVLERHMETHEGTAFVIESRTRLVPVDSLKLDPNRMFSRAGAESNLKALNADAAPQQVDRALQVLDRGREKLLGPGYSVATEVPISDQTSLREPGDPHAFFLCTDPRDFDVLKTSPYNVVLQQRAPAQDDGSLSRLAAARGFRYVNLEVAAGQTERQREMLNWLEWYIQ